MEKDEAPIENNEVPLCLACQFKQIDQKMGGAILSLTHNMYSPDWLFELFLPFKGTELGYFICAWFRCSKMFKLIANHIRKHEYEKAAELFNQYPKTISLKKRKR